MLVPERMPWKCVTEKPFPWSLGVHIQNIGLCQGHQPLIPSPIQYLIPSSEGLYPQPKIVVCTELPRDTRKQEKKTLWGKASKKAHICMSLQSCPAYGPSIMQTAFNIAKSIKKSRWAWRPSIKICSTSLSLASLSCRRARAENSHENCRTGLKVTKQSQAGNLGTAADTHACTICR